MNAEIMVPGIPEPKGSFTPVKRGRKIFLMDGRDGKTHERRKDWKHRVAFYGAAYMRANAVASPCDAPIVVDLTFYMPRPKSVSKNRVHCAVKPDIDKLSRGCLDPLVGVVITEDSRVVDLHARKVYADAENPAGVFIRIWSV